MRKDGLNEIRSTIKYEKEGDSYFLKLILREGKNVFPNGKNHSFGIEMAAVDSYPKATAEFTNTEITSKSLAQIPYDSVFWNNASLLEETTLEREIIDDLGKGLSLKSQFLQYQQFEWATTNGGDDGLKKFNWLLQHSKDHRALCVVFWNSNFRQYLKTLEEFKELGRRYRNTVTFVLISNEPNNQAWIDYITQFNFFVEGILNYRIENLAESLSYCNLNEYPSVRLLLGGNTIKIESIHDPKLIEHLENSLR
jgi:hypothetical protein